MLDSQKLNAFQALGIGPAWVARASTARDTHASRPEPLEAPAAELRGDPLDQTDPVAIEERWSALATRVSSCRDCPLGSTRQHPVFGTGSRSARWMLVGEAPGAEEDRSGEPFVGRAGALLDAILKAASLDRSREVYIANVLKCRPPGNRNPEPDEVAKCEPHLQQQVELLKPQILVLMGRFAAQTLLGTEASIASLRGRLHAVQLGGMTIPAVVTYHPAYLLRNPADKRLAWADWCLARREFSALLRQSAIPNQTYAGLSGAAE